MDPLRPTLFSTHDLRPQDQFEAWHEWFRPVFDIASPQTARGSFAAEHKVWDLGGLLITHAMAPPARVLRTKVNLNRAPADHWVLAYCRHGKTTIRSSAGLLQAPAGVPFLWSLGEVLESERTSVDRLQIFIPRDLYRDIAHILDASRGSSLDTPLGHLLGDYMIALERWLPAVQSEDLPRLGVALHSVIAACIASSSDRIALARNQISHSRAERVHRIVDKNLKSRLLTPAALCRIAGISRSQMYRLFECSGGVARYIQQQRLLQIHAAISDPANQRPLIAIAEEYGFADGSTFSRAFRQEFGYSPSDARTQAFAGMPLSVRSRARRECKTAHFSDFLRAYQN
jgi:AraC-like DNA-binding protein